LFKNFALTVGKQNLNFSLRDNKSYSWAYGDPIALVGNYSTRDLDVKAYFAKLNEGSAVPGAGTNDTDKELLGVYGEYWLNDDSLVICYLNSLSAQGFSALTDSYSMVHYGIGLDYFVGEALEFYGEVAGQSIDLTGTPTATLMDGSAIQLNLGVEYTFADYQMKPSINVEYLLQSGADTSDPSWQDVISTVRSAENQSLYVEGGASEAGGRGINMVNGLVSNSANLGYSVIRINGWINPSQATKVGLGIHLFTNENNVAGVSDDIGMEIDLTGKWTYSPDMSFAAGAFLLTGSENAGGVGGGLPSGTEYEDVMGFSVSSALTF
ncbi:MAG: hypothetical protein HQL31_13290, partial [Planctomycetes bacterium]|nr:hypothetical protein [Planctomycetota bacterium]